MSQDQSHTPENFQEAVKAFRAGDHRAARSFCMRRLAEAPYEPDSRRLIASIDFKDGHVEAAAGHLESLLEQQPGDLQSRVFLARCKRLLGESDSARGIIEDVLHQTPDSRPALDELIELDLQSGREEEALSKLRKLFDADRGNLEPGNRLGTLQAKLNRYDDAEETFQELLKAHPASAITHYNLAHVLRDKGENEGAIKEYTIALEHDPKLIEAWHNLASLHWDRKDPVEAARAHFQEFKLRRFDVVQGEDKGDMAMTSRSKLEHDIEQFTYIHERKLTKMDLGPHIEHYKQALAALPPEAQGTHVVPIPEDFREALRPTYNKAVYWHPEPAHKEGAINPDIDWTRVEEEYFDNDPGYVWVDNLLRPEALEAIRRFCLTSTIWYEYRYANGYLGAFQSDGFFCPLILQAADELRRAMPRVFKEHQLRKLWSFKCDSRYKALDMHADFAAVNCNFWITPDEANLDQESGGLTVWNKEAPLEWDFERYNSDQQAMQAFLEESGASAVNVPHRQNRILIFNSDLLHRSGDLHFKSGYEYRRINITLLYGKREEA